MVIRLYENSSEPEKLDKNLTEIVEISGAYFKEDTSLLSPRLILSGSADDLKTANYMYIPQAGRYYYITDIKSIRAGLWEISGRVDVLYTYKDEIRDNRAIISRSEKNYELKLDDGSLKIFNNPKITTKTFPNGFTTNIEFVLAVAG